MKTPYYTLLLPCAIALTACSEPQPSATDDLVLHYDAPAQYMEESLPIGNGQLGALVYGGTAEEHLSLNDITLWTGGPDTVAWTPNAARYLPAVRQALDREDYAAAEAANRMIEGHNSEIYQPLGTLWINDLSPIDSITDYQRTLNISRAVATVNYACGDKKIERQYLASAADSVIIVHLKAYGTSLHQRIALQTQQHVTLSKAEAADTQLPPRIVLEGYTAYSTHPEAGKDEWFHYDENRGVHFRTELRVLAPDHCVMTEGDSALVITGCDEATILLTDVTSYNGPYRDPVREGRDYRTAVRQRLDAACQQRYDQLLSRHEEDYQRLFSRVSLDLGTTPDSLRQLPTDRQLLLYSAPLHCEREVADSVEQLTNPDLVELYFQYGRYLLISSSRTSGIPANLQGLWNERITPPWSCNYTANINVEENYWPAEVGALPEMHQALLDWVQLLPKSGMVTAQQYYDIHDAVNGAAPWCMCHNSDVWCTTNPVGYQKDSPKWACWPLGGVWTCTHLWEHYAFTLDKAFLAKAYPVMKGAAAFALQWLVERDGQLMTMPSTSPENEYTTDEGLQGGTCYGGSADVAMIRELLTDIRMAADELKAAGDAAVAQDTEFLARIDSTLAHLMPYKIGRQGNLQEWYHNWADKDPQHRHQSHLFGLYPGHHITCDGTPDLAAACATTLDVRGDRTTGWSAGWRVNLQARLHNAREAYHILRKLLTFVHPDGYKGEDRRHGGGTYPNLFDAHAPFQIDGNFGGTAGIMEMLVESRYLGVGEAEAILLPALPQQWSAQGRVSGLRLRGGYELSMEWRDGKVTRYDVKPLHGTHTRLTLRTASGEVLRTVE